jgi:formylglycine-generating enzyme required for sulfatase activity
MSTGHALSRRRTGALHRLTLVALLALAAWSATAVNDRWRAGREFDDCGAAGWCPRMVVIPAGSFIMGAGPGEAPNDLFSEGPQHRVRVRRFALGKFDVTRGEWAAFVDATHRPTRMGCSWTPRVPDGKVDSTASWRDPGFAQDDRHPVVCVTWYDAQDYVQWLSRRTGHRYRIPSEAEWEYAARAGTRSAYWWGNEIGREHAACRGCGEVPADRTMPAGSFPANPFGLFDTAGNAAEWVEDCWNDSYHGAPADGSAWTRAQCQERVLRGGSYGNDPRYLRSAARFKYDADVRYIAHGFRVVRELR